MRIAEALGITARYVGEEPKSLVTGIYNRIMSERLPEHRIVCVIVPRKTEESGQVISASNVRQAIKDGRLEDIRELIPESTYRFFASPEADEVVRRIRETTNVIHY